MDLCKDEQPSSDSSLLDSGSEYAPRSENSSSEDSETGLLFLPGFEVGSSVKKKWEGDRCQVAALSTCPEPSSQNLKAAGLFVSGSFVETVSSSSHLEGSSTHYSEPSTSHGDVSSSTSCAAATPTCKQAETQSCSSVSSSVRVHVAKNTAEKRVWDKQSFCKFCEKPSTNLTKHVLCVHKSEPEVTHILAQPKGSSKRALLLEKLRNHGNYLHNCAVLKNDKGVLIPWRSPSEEVNASDYIPCEFCLGFFLKKDLWRHEKTCKFRVTSAKKRRVISSAQQLLPAEGSCSEGLQRNIFSSMNVDEVSSVARNDQLIVAYGEKLYQQHGHFKHRGSYIKQKIRYLSRFLIAARKECEHISDLESCIDPAQFLVVISVVRKICGYSSEKNAYSNPSLAMKLGHTLKRCATVLRNFALMDGNLNLQTKAENFNSLCDSDWQSYVSSAALATLKTRKLNTPHVFPLTEDIRIVTKYLVEERRQRLMNLKTEPSVEVWHALAKASLANIVMFNRRRSGEAARMTISDFEAAKSNSVPQDDVLKSLSELEKELVSSFLRVEIFGKFGNKVPVLLTHDMCSEIEELCASREKAEVSSENVYVFARPYYSSEDHLPGHKCLHDAAVKSGAKHPEHITSTKLRKHIATVSQILNLSEHELDQVCRFMGHDVRVHREFYRLPEGTLQLAKVSRLLLAMEQGRISEFQGKSLDEIQVDIEAQESDAQSDKDAESDSVADVALLDCELDARCQPDSRTKTALKQCTSGTIKKDYMTTVQMQLVHKHFRKHIDDQCIPRKADCEELLRTEPLLAGKSWSKIKCTVRNEIVKNKRQLKKLQNR